MLRGMMMDTPLNVSAAIEYGAEMHPDARIVSATIEGGIHRTTYAETAPRVAQLAHALRALGVREGDRIGQCARRVRFIAAMQFQYRSAGRQAFAQ